MRAAGILLAAKSTSRVLLLLRSGDVSEPYTWCLPGGKVDEGESTRGAAVRELEEEAGWDGDVNILREPIYVYEGDDFTFTTYFGWIPREFEPQLNWETDEADWFALDALPQPLHRGVVELFRQRRRQIEREIARL